jgi:hypothetical protein
MLKVLYWLLLDGFFLYATISFWGELRGFKFLLLAVVAFFTWELIKSIKNCIKK